MRRSRAAWRGLSVVGSRRPVERCAKAGLGQIVKE